MTRVGIRELKTHLSEYVKEVRRGEEVVITDHGKPVARLIGNAISKDASASLASLAVEGLVILPTKKYKSLNDPAMLNGKGKSLSDFIVEDRR